MSLGQRKDSGMQKFDFIIIGGGSAGCVLADKLSACGTYSVLLLEAGPSDKRFWIKVPIGYGNSFHNPKVNWRFNGVPDDGLGGRSSYAPRGKVLGGSSSINALVYHRGQAGDYDDWAAAGNSDWDYAAVKPIFDSYEIVGNREETANKAREPKLSVTDASASYHHLSKDFLDICQETQLPSDASPPIEGAGVGPYYITTRNGLRCSSATAFLDPARKRRNLTIITNIHISRIITDNRRAIGVEGVRRGQNMRFDAGREIILSAGAVGSPQILQLSGIGSGKLLKKHDIDVVLDQPNVGQHMQDHLGVNYIFKANQPTLNDVLGKWHRRLALGMKYVLRQSGPLALSVNQVGGLVKSAPNLTRPDTQLYMNPMSYTVQYNGKRPLTKPDNFPGFIIGFNSCRPKSRGSVEINSADSHDQPKIWGNYLSHNDDLDDVVRMARLIEKMQSTKALNGILSEPGLTPLGEMSDDEIIDDFKARSGTVFHLCGTCRMTPDASQGVVDQRLRVHNMDRLRVCDASIFPNVTSANTNAPTIMVAHKGAQMILADNRG